MPHVRCEVGPHRSPNALSYVYERLSTPPQSFFRRQRLCDRHLAEWHQAVQIEFELVEDGQDLQELPRCYRCGIAQIDQVPVRELFLTIFRKDTQEDHWARLCNACCSAMVIHDSMKEDDSRARYSQ